MAKHSQRWYEKEESLSAFIDLMKDLSSEEQCEIAIDMILKISEVIERDYSKIIEDVANFDPKNYKRWYDKNPNIHLAIEALRDLDENQRIGIINQFSNKIIDLYKIKGIEI